ncbi:unnamed protein product [Alternaria burnsii]|nr:unnamed protein product [Alternaria burnsii]
MDHVQQLVTLGDNPREERAYRDPASIESVEYRIRSEPNHLYEDPDIDEDIVYRIIPGAVVTKRHLDICAEQFSTNYGVWSQRARLVMGSWAEYGKHIRLSRDRLRAQCLPDGVNNILVIAITKNGLQVGYCFISQWMHGDDRVWWITQLLVLEGYRNQGRATKVTLAMHYDVGRSTRRDLVGVASSNPYTICTLLRVFGRGIEVLPSKPDWEENPVRHTPLPISACEPIVKAAPVNYIRDAKLLPGTLTVNTRFFIDHAAPDEALTRIVYSMNKQLVEPWEWLFGHLEPGCEYLCILDYSFDSEYRLDSVLHDELTISSAAQPKEGSSNRTKKTFEIGSSKHLKRSSSLIQYDEIDRYLLEVPSSCQLDPKCNRAYASLYDSVRKLIFEAKGLIETTPMLSIIMSAKQIPDDLRRVYQSVDFCFPLPEQVRTWADFTEYAYGVFEEDINVAARLLILQAIHFQELRDDHESPQRARVMESLELVKLKRMREKGQSAKRVRQKPTIQRPRFTANTSRDKDSALSAKPRKGPGLTPMVPPRKPLAPKPRGPSKIAEMPAKTDAYTTKPRTTSMLSSIGNSFRRLRVSNPRRSLSESKPRGPIPATNASNDTPAPTEETPPQTPLSRSFGPIPRTAPIRISAVPKDPFSAKVIRRYEHEAHAAITPPATPLSSQPQADLPRYMAPTMSSMQRYKTHSPELFYSDESDDGSRSSVSGRPCLKNSGKVLDRTWGKRG